MPLTTIELKVKDVMTRDPVCVRPSTTIRELARFLKDLEISGAPVVDHQDRVIGVVSMTDAIRRCSEGVNETSPAHFFEVVTEQGDDEDSPEYTPEPAVRVEDFMTEEPPTVSPDWPVAVVAQLMFEKRLRRVVVVDEENFPVGIITPMDLLGAFPKEE